MNWEEKRLSREIGKGAAAMAGALATRHGLDTAATRETADFLSQKLAELSGLGRPLPPSQQPIIIEGVAARLPATAAAPAVAAKPVSVPAPPAARVPATMPPPAAEARRTSPDPVSVAEVQKASPEPVPARTSAASSPARPLETPARRPGRPKSAPSKERRKLVARKSAAKAEKASQRSAARIGKTVFLRRIVSLEDGQSYQDLRPHLKSLGMTPDQYRRKHGLPAHYPMVPPALFLKSAEYVVVATF